MIAVRNEGVAGCYAPVAVAALPTTVAGPDARGRSSERLRLLRELGARAVPSWAALETGADGRTQLVIVERAERGAFDDAEIADWIRDARRMAALDHPSVARVRDVVIREGEVLVVSDFVDGVTWRDYSASAPLESALRVALDVLAGLSALHGLRDGRKTPPPLIHGALGPDEVVVGLDGVARVVGASRPQSASAAQAGASCAHLAPEVLLEDDSADARADVYSVGVLLWEAIARRPFLPDMQPSAIVSTLLSGRAPAVTVPPDAPWAEAVAAIVQRALSADPEKRFPSAAAMAAEVRRAGGARVTATSRIAGAVREAFGEGIRARRADLERGEVRASDVSIRGARPVRPPPEAAPQAAHDAQTVPPPAPNAPTVPPPALPGPPDAPEMDLPFVPPFATPAPRRRGPLGVAIAATAVVVVALGAWWAASRGPDTRSAAPANTMPATATAAATVPRPAPPPAVDSAPSAPEPASAPSPPPAVEPAPAKPALHAPPPPRPRARRGYDPQGI